MSNTVIKVENLSKQYRLGEVGTGTLSHDLKRWWYKTRGKEDPFLKIGETNDRTSKGESDYVWALRNISFEVKQGEVLGIIGRNGAGKSTLLKILSKTTAPTTGNIKIKGRIASLLEVGTGFHPELSGRENIYLNGAILGMTKREITSKFDAIVDFAGIERYVDTPVKRYSSGMYVRLAFAVAAYLESEILIVDEVLAVGDAEFQKKCLGKMKDVSVNDGRTVLFVSHNMAAMRSLCNSGLLLNKGTVEIAGGISNVVSAYFDAKMDEDKGTRSVEGLKNDLLFKRWYIKDGEKEVFICEPRKSVSFYFECILKRDIEDLEFGFIIRDGDGTIIFGCNSRDNNGKFITLNNGKHIIEFAVRLPIRSNKYEIDITAAASGQLIDQWVSKTPLTIFSSLQESVLDEAWTGIVKEIPSFKVHR